MRFTNVTFPIEVARVTLPFGSTLAPWYSPQKPHKGVDLAPYPGSFGAPVDAPIGGTVVATGEHTYAGLYVIQTGSVPFSFGARDLSGTVRTVAPGSKLTFRNAHLQTIHVAQGQRVRKNQQLGEIGSTGKASSGAHLHLELWLGDYGTGTLVDPMDFFAASLVGLKQSVVYA